MPISDFNFFAPATQRWFASALGEPTAVQTEAWPAIADNHHTLVAAPTGTGKTLSAFLVFVDRLIAQSRASELPDELQVIYISPLKSLAGDIRENLRKPLSGIYNQLQEEDNAEDAHPFSLRVAIRTGDTPQSERRRMVKTPPHILITTPESLYLLLTSQSGQGILKTAKAIIIDELHALIGTKRGAHLMLSLARIDALCPAPLVRIGLSATIEPLDLAAAYLSPDEVTIAAPKMQKSAEVLVCSPLTSENAATQGTIWLDLAQTVYERCQQAGNKSVLVFTGGRQFAEKLAHYVNDIAGCEFAHTHHGSVSKKRRLETERALREGDIRLLCATSSMELGIDIGDINEVIQIGCPFSISSTLQRLGRAGHNPGRTSVMRMYPRMTYDALFCGLTTMAVRQGKIEQSRPPRLCLDVLAQHLVSMAAESYTVDDVLRLLPRAYPFRGITRGDVTALLEMLAGDYEHARDIPVRPRLLYDRVNGTVQGDAYSRLLAASAGGTIPDRGMFAVKTEANVKLGELDEEFVFEARVGHKFLLGSFAWRITSIQKDKVVVAPASREGAQPPFWRNDPVGRPVQTGRFFGEAFRKLNEAAEEGTLLPTLESMGMDEITAIDAGGLVSRQLEALGTLADDRTIVIEHFADDAGDNMCMVHSVFGRPVNAPLALLLQDAAAKSLQSDILTYEDDNGILLISNGEQPLPRGFLQTLQADTARAFAAAKLPATALFSTCFRYNAARALMMGVRKAGRQPLWVQRMRGAEMLAAVIDHPNHPLLRETTRECLEDFWDLSSLEIILRDIASGQIRIREVFCDSASPMSLNLRRQAEGELLYSYAPVASRVIRNAQDAADLAGLIEPSPDLLQPYTRAKLPEDELHLHSLLMMEGDIVAGELDVPAQWFASLAKQNRAAYIEPGLWIAAEHADEYEKALEFLDSDALQHITRRLLRYRGAQTAQTLAERYSLPEDAAQAALDALCAIQTAVEANGQFYHAELYNRARRDTIFARRKEQTTRPSSAYSALLSNRLRIPAPPAEQVEAAVRALMGREWQPALVESALLPARVANYRPAMLDTLLAQGEIIWHLAPDKDGHARLTFAPYTHIDWDAPLPPAPENADEQIVFDALCKRGASFSQGLYSLLDGVQPGDVLLSLAAQGYVRADSFAPVRQWLDRDKLGKAPVKQRARTRVASVSAGRWEISRPLRSLDMESLLHTAFDRFGILCRETARECNLPWASALETLGIWEYTNKARRGYFIEGMSGAQFIRESDFASTTLALDAPNMDIIWLSAVDPLQVWGKILPHMDGRAFACLPGSAVALCAGRPVCVMEKQGQTLQVFEAEHLGAALSAFAREYGLRRIFPSAKRINVKKYPPEAAEALASAGFARSMNDFTLHQGYL